MIRYLAPSHSQSTNTVFYLLWSSPQDSARLPSSTAGVRAVFALFTLMGAAHTRNPHSLTG